MSTCSIPQAVQFTFLGEDRQLISLQIYHRNPLIAESLAVLAERSGFTILNNGRPLKLHTSTTVAIVDIDTVVDWGANGYFSKQDPACGRQIIVTSYDQLMHFGHLIPENVAGLVSNKSPFEVYRRAIKHVASGKQFIDADLAGPWSRMLEGSKRRLTARQLQIVRYIAKGLSSRAIAKELGLSPSTIENHRSRILQRVGVGSSAELVLYAKKQGWI